MEQHNNCNSLQDRNPGGFLHKGVLVAISIPIFTAQLEKSREATDAANLRSAYAELTAGLLTDEAVPDDITVTQKQTVAGWATSPDLPFTVADPTASGSWTVSIDASTGAVTATHS